MSILNFRKKSEPAPMHNGDVTDFVAGFSIEVMPRTAAKIEDFKALLPADTRVYIAHIDGTPIEDMVETAKRLNADGFRVMPHFPARIIKDQATLEDWISRYQGEADIREALVLAGGVDSPVGDFASSMDLLASHAFDKAGFTNLHVAGHPEGNKDIDPDGGTKVVEEALLWKEEFSKNTDAKMAIATQFAFEAEPLIAWANHLREIGVNLPVHIGVAGPAKLQTLIKFAIACGVGPSLRVLERRALDVTKLLLPYTPDDVVTELAAYKTAHPDFAIEALHIFPLGGIRASADWAATKSTVAAAAG